MARPGEDLVTTLIRLHEALKVTTLPLQMPGANKARKQIRDAVLQLEDYVLPRALQIEAPLLAVVGGSTGAGKSTLVNSIVGEVVTEAGVLRPTTRSPVLVHNPRDARWFLEQRILPDFERTSEASQDPGVLQLVASRSVPRGIALLDAPDVDSLEVQNRELASQLLAAADMWLFVTSAARYADALPWTFLRQAADRRAAVAIVLDRTQAKSIDEVASHLNRMLVARGLRDSPLFKVAEAPLDSDGLLPPESVEQIQVWLEALAADADTRAAVIRQTLDGAIRSITERAYALADACGAQEDASVGLGDGLGEEFARAAAEFEDAITDGTLAKGEVRRAWHAWAAAEAAANADGSRLGRARDRFRRALSHEQPIDARLAEALAAAVRTALRSSGSGAGERVERRWRSTAAGKALLVGGSGASEVAFVHACSGAADAWREAVIEVSGAAGSAAGLSPREIAGLSLAAQVAVVTPDSRSDVAGAHAYIQRVIPADAARLIARARAELMRAVESVLWDQKQHYVRRLESQGLDGNHAERIRDLARRIDDLRIMREDWQ